jgi:hypothetical protein
VEPFHGLGTSFALRIARAVNDRKPDFGYVHQSEFVLGWQIQLSQTMVKRFYVHLGSLEFVFPDPRCGTQGCQRTIARTLSLKGS